MHNRSRMLYTVEPWLWYSRRRSRCHRCWLMLGGGGGGSVSRGRAQSAAGPELIPTRRP